jgi:hypothetical protein
MLNYPLTFLYYLSQNNDLGSLIVEKPFFFVNYFDLIHLKNNSEFDKNHIFVFDKSIIKSFNQLRLNLEKIHSKQFSKKNKEFPYKFIIIKNFDHYKRNFQQFFKSYLDEKFREIKFFFICQKVNKICETISSRCLVLEFSFFYLDNFFYEQNLNYRSYRYFSKYKDNIKIIFSKHISENRILIKAIQEFREERHHSNEINFFVFEYCNIFIIKKLEIINFFSRYSYMYWKFLKVYSNYLILKEVNR